MHVHQLSIDGEDFIGLMGMSTDSYAILSPKFPGSDALGVPAYGTLLYGTHLVGLFCAGNSRGLLLPYFIPGDEVSLLKDFFSGNGIDVEVGVLEGNCTAVGNLIACNDKAAVVSPKISSLDVVEDVLGVEVFVSDVGGHEEVGACCVVTNNGFVSHPDVGGELEKLSEVFGVHGDVGSVNFGFPFIRSGLVANSNGYLVGGKTTGIELGRIDDALGFLD